MNKFMTAQATAADCKLCLASIAGVYSPLILIIGAALILF